MSHFFCLGGTVSPLSDMTSFVLRQVVSLVVGSSLHLPPMHSFMLFKVQSLSGGNK